MNFEESLERALRDTGWQANKFVTGGMITRAVLGDHEKRIGYPDYELYPEDHVARRSHDWVDWDLHFMGERSGEEALGARVLASSLWPTRSWVARWQSAAIAILEHNVVDAYEFLLSHNPEMAYSVSHANPARRNRRQHVGWEFRLGSTLRFAHVVVDGDSWRVDTYGRD